MLWGGALGTRASPATPAAVGEVGSAFLEDGGPHLSATCPSVPLPAALLPAASAPSETRPPAASPPTLPSDPGREGSCAVGKGFSGQYSPVTRTRSSDMRGNDS